MWFGFTGLKQGERYVSFLTEFYHEGEFVWNELWSFFFYSLLSANSWWRWDFQFCFFPPILSLHSFPLKWPTKGHPKIEWFFKFFFSLPAPKHNTFPSRNKSLSPRPGLPGPPSRHGDRYEKNNDLHAYWILSALEYHRVQFLALFTSSIIKGILWSLHCKWTWHYVWWYSMFFLFSINPIKIPKPTLNVSTTYYQSIVCASEPDISSSSVPQGSIVV